MPLPKTKHPLFETNLPSTGKMIVYRQLLVSDEKILLMAKASEDETDIFRAVKQVVNNCIFDENIDSFTTFDIEWLFLKIRASSIGDTIELVYTEEGEEEEYKFQVNLNDVIVKFPDGISNTIKINDTQALQLRHPPAALFDEAMAMSEGDDSYEYIAARCIDKIFDDDEVYIAADSTIEELVQFIHGMTTKPYQEVKDFIATTPHLYYTIEYKTKDEEDRKIVLTTLTDFFTLR
jgi:hypothetical protein